MMQHWVRLLILQLAYVCFLLCTYVCLSNFDHVRTDIDPSTKLQPPSHAHATMPLPQTTPPCSASTILLPVAGMKACHYQHKFQQGARMTHCPPNHPHKYVGETVDSWWNTCVMRAPLAFDMLGLRCIVKYQDCHNWHHSVQLVIRCRAGLLYYSIWLE